MHNLQISSLIQCLTVLYTFRTSRVRPQADNRIRSFCVVCIHALVQAVMYKYVNTPYKNCLPEDEPMRFETCRRR